MSFPTVTVTPGSGQTINTLPNAGQATMANSLPVALASDQSALNIQAATTGGTTTYAAISVTATGTGPLLTNSAVAVKASPGTFYRVRGYNPNATIIWIQLFDLASGSVTLGTTVPKDPIPLLPNAGFDELLSGDFGAVYLTAITAAATTTSTGNTAPATGITATFYFK